MKTHSEARTTAFQRTRIVEKVQDKSWTLRAAASGVSRRTIYKWLARARSESQARSATVRQGPT